MTRSPVGIVRGGDELESDSPLPRIAMISTHGYVAANPPLGAADTVGQVVYVLEVAKNLAVLGYQVDIWGAAVRRATGDRAREALESEPFDLVLLDWMLPDHDGLDVLRYVRNRGWRMPVLFVTARTAPADQAEAFESGAS